LTSVVVAAATIAAASASAQTVRGFDGFYAGAHGSYGKVDNTGNADVEGGLGGIHVGYNYVAGSILIGGEADYDWADVSYTQYDPLGGFGGKLSIDLNYLASVRGRLGWVYQSALFYATAGYAWSEVEVALTIPGLGHDSASVDLDGPVAGGGVEYKFSNAISGRIEGLHYWGGNDDVSEDEDLETNVIRAGLSYHLP
jgi:outer membrane immunogenic protein